MLVDQVHHLDELTADADLRRLTAETPLADQAWREARTDSDRHTASLEETRRRIADLLEERDALLDRLLELSTATGRG